VEILLAFGIIVGILLAVIFLAVLIGIVTRSEARAVRYWSIHPWDVFWLSYVPVDMGIQFLRYDGPIAYVLLVPGTLLTVASAIQGLRVTWLRSRLHALLILLSFFAFMILVGLPDRLAVALIASSSLIFLWSLAAWLAETVCLRQSRSANGRTGGSSDQWHIKLDAMYIGRTLLFAVSPPLWRCCLLAWLLALIPGYLLYFSASEALAFAGVNFDWLYPPSKGTSWPQIFNGVVGVPIVETFVLGAGLRAVSLFTTRTILVAAVTGIIWGCLHGIFGALWFFPSAWSFFVLSCAYLAWSEVSSKHAFIAAYVPHVLTNLTAYSPVLIWILKGA